MRRINGSIIGPRITTGYGMWSAYELFVKRVSNSLLTNYSNSTVTYSFTSNNATATFNGVTIIGYAGNNGGNNGGGGGAGGTYSIVNNNGYGYGVNGGAGGTPTYGGNANGGGGGGIGGSDAGAGNGAFSIDMNQLFSVVTAAGYNDSFGRGGYAGGNGGALPIFAGGGGSGFSAGNAFDPLPNANIGANAAIVLQYISINTTYSQVINQSSGDGSVSLPSGTSAVKIWAIGKGGNGGADGGALNGGGGGGAGGTAWCEFY